MKEENKMNIYLLNSIITGKVLLELLCDKMDIKGIISLIPSKKNRSIKEYYDCSDLCKQRKIESVFMQSYNMDTDSDKRKLCSMDIDLIFVTGWQRLVPEWLIEHCGLGIIGCHGSAEGISRGRGRSPQNWALILGKKEFELSIFWIEKGIDNGKIIDSRRFEYQETDNILVSYIKCNMYVADMVEQNWKKGKIQNYSGTQQTKEGYYLPKRVENDGAIDWKRSCNEIYNFVRALGKPYPGAFSICHNKKYFIYEAKPINIEVGYEKRCPGEILSIIDTNILIKCGNGLLLCNDMRCGELVPGMIFESTDYKIQMADIINRHRYNVNLPISDMVLKEVEKGSS